MKKTNEEIAKDTVYGIYVNGRQETRDGWVIEDNIIRELDEKDAIIAEKEARIKELEEALTSIRNRTNMMEGSIIIMYQGQHVVRAKDILSIAEQALQKGSQ